MSETFLAVVLGREYGRQWNRLTLEEAIYSVAECGPRDDIAKETISIFHITNGTARKVWQGTPEDARAGRGHVTEEPAPKIPPCKYPVGTVLRLGDWSPCQKPTTVTAARISWVYSYLHPSHGDETNASESMLDRHYVVAPPDPYPVGSEHVVDLGLLGRQTAKVVHRDGDLLSFVVLQHQQATGVAFFEKAVVK